MEGLDIGRVKKKKINNKTKKRKWEKHGRVKERDKRTDKIKAKIKKKKHQKVF